MDGSERNTIMLDWDANVDLYWWTCTCTRGVLGRTDYAGAARLIEEHARTVHGGEVDIRHGDLMRYAALGGQRPPTHDGDSELAPGSDVPRPPRGQCSAVRGGEFD